MKKEPDPKLFALCLQSAHAQVGSVYTTDTEQLYYFCFSFVCNNMTYSRTEIAFLKNHKK